MERRNTKQRQIILDAVRSRMDHPGAEQIYNQVHAVDPKISMGTVYRNLALLAEEGKILAIRLPDADRFDLTTGAHNHFVCEKCGRVFDVDIDYDSSLDERCTESGFVIHSHQTVFSGVCPECSENQI